MSVQVASDKHIAAIIGYYAENTRGNHDSALKKLAQTLLDFNVKAYDERYADSSHIPKLGSEKWTYGLGRARLLSRDFSPVEILKLCTYYSYQVCELEGWETSKAHEVIERVSKTAISKLPGYEDAPWGIESD